MARRSDDGPSGGCRLCARMRPGRQRVRSDYLSLPLIDAACRHTSHTRSEHHGHSWRNATFHPSVHVNGEDDMLKVASIFAPAMVALFLATSAGAQAPDLTKPGAVVAEVVELKATVTAVDRADRTVTLR